MEIQAQTLKAFRYPLIITAVFMAMLFILLVVLLPEIAKFMEMSSIPLPWSIKILLSLSHLYRSCAELVFPTAHVQQL